MNPCELHGVVNIIEIHFNLKAASQSINWSGAVYLLLSGVNVIISDISHSSILQNVSIVLVLTLSFLFSLVICDGLIPYV